MIKDWFSKWAIYSPNKIAVKEHETNRVFTYDELNRISNCLAYYLIHTFQVKKGDRIILLFENAIEHLLLFGVAQKMGCILVPINYKLTAKELDFLLENAKPHLIIYEGIFKDKLSKTNYFYKIPHNWTKKNIDACVEAAQQNTLEKQLEQELITDDDPIFLIYTSGTTGFPKAAIYTHKMLFWNSINTALSLILNTRSRTINCMPFFHTGGWNVLLSPILHHGGYIYLVKSFDPDTILSLIESEAPSMFVAVPTMLKMLADHPKFAATDLGSLHYIIVGGAPMPIPLIKKWHEKKVYIRQGFGMTEVGPNLTSLHQKDAIRKIGSIGRPNFYVSVKIIDEAEEEILDDRPGELLLKGPMVTPGYWNDIEATNCAIKDGWFYTGDLVKRDEEGYLYVVDRIKNMYISGGENIYPAEIERTLIKHPCVSEVAVIGVMDKKWGEVGKAFIVKRNQQLVEETLFQYCKDQLAKFKIPKYFTFLEQLPKNDTGKINRRLLKQL